MFTSTLRQFLLMTISGTKRRIHSAKHHTQISGGYAFCAQRKEKNGDLLINRGVEQVQISGTISKSFIKYILLAKNLILILSLRQPLPLKASLHMVELPRLILVLSKLLLSGWLILSNLLMLWKTQSGNKCGK